MAEGYDRKKISFFRFLQALYPMQDPDNRLNYNKIPFKILDMDRDGTLNILNILHLIKNIPTKSGLGNEIFKLMNWQVKNNLHSKSSVNRRERLNYDVYCKVVGRSCIIQEIRDVVFGASSEKEEPRTSIFKQEDDGKPFPFEYYL